MSTDKPVKPWWSQYMPDVFVRTLPGIPYEMPDCSLPLKDCGNCQWHQEGWRDGGFCYMFRVEPDGDKCGQMTALQGDQSV